MDTELKKLELKIRGTHCANCEILIERQFKKVSGVEKVNVDYATGRTEVYYSKQPSLEELQSRIAEHGYALSYPNDKTEESHSQEKPEYLKILGVLVGIIGVYYGLKSFGLIPKLGFSENMSYGFVFLLGLVAAVSTCLAVAGGLLLAVAAKYNESHPKLSGWQKFKPNLYFNIGRIISYAFLGAIIGAFGSVLTLSTRINGVLTLLASAIMILLGFQLLHIFPWLRRFYPRMPKFLGHTVHNAASKESKAGPFFLGASTFFLPCGFTIALQLYVLSKGSAVTGALTMLVFALGTLPSLLSLGAISSFAKGAFQSNFLRFAGVVVILLAVFNIGNGLTLAGIDVDLFPNAQVEAPAGNIDTTGMNPFIAQYIKNAQAPAEKVDVVDGKQIVRMKIVDLNYVPSKFIVAKGVPVEWQIDASKAAGCAQVITVPKLGLVKYLSSNKVSKIEFTPKSEGKISFSCTMGMTTPRASFTVI